MSCKPNLDQRKSRPQSIGGVFGGILRAFGGRASDADLANRWAEIMGKDISDNAVLVGISKGTGNKGQGTRDKGQGFGRTITVKSINSAAALVLSYQVNEIQSRANKYFGYNAIGKVVVRK